MATILKEAKGSKAGTSAARFQAYAAIRVTQTSASSGYYLQTRRYLLFSPASGYGGTDGFGGTTFERNWGADFKVYGNGKGDGSSKIYGDSGWVDYGWVAPGSTYSLTAECGYTSSSSGRQESSVTISVKVMSAPSACSNTRASDSRNDVSWVNGTGHTAVKVERRIDGGSWAEIASVAATTNSYSDSTTSANHSYAYRVRGYDSVANAHSAYAESSATYNTPAAPASLTVARSSETGVLVTISNPANTATGLDLQRSGDGSSWEDVASLSGSPVTSATDSPGGGTFYYRARNTRGNLASAWSPASSAVVTMCPPAAPTLVAPAAGRVISVSQSAVRFEWAHNAIDGSTQTAAQVRYSTNGGSSWNTITSNSADQHFDRSNAFGENVTVTWSVRTKGAHSDYGPWSGNRTFRVYQQPSVSVSSPSSGATVTTTPITLRASYSDPSGSLANLVFDISDSNGNPAFSIDAGTSTRVSVSPSQWLPTDGETYVIRATARSTSSLTATASSSFSVSFTPPRSATADIEYDPESGTASLVIRSSGTTGEAISTISVYRERGGKRALVADGLSIGSGITDANAPINVDYQYVVVTFASSGAASLTFLDAHLKSPYFFFLFDGKTARGKWNPVGTIRTGRSSKQRVSYAGRTWPVSYDGDNAFDERSVTFTLRTKEEADAFWELGAGSGRCVYKSGDGDVIAADATVSLTPSYMMPTYYGKATVALVRIDGGDL